VVAFADEVEDFLVVRGPPDHVRLKGQVESQA
jgi:hypothetical protein